MSTESDIAQGSYLCPREKVIVRGGGRGASRTKIPFYVIMRHRDLGIYKNRASTSTNNFRCFSFCIISLLHYFSVYFPPLIGGKFLLLIDAPRG